MISRLITIVFWVVSISCMILFTSCDEDSPVSPEITTYTVSGRVVDISGNGISGVSVSISGETSVTDSSGYYTFEDMLNGMYSLTCIKDDYLFTPSSVAVTVNQSDVTVDDITEYDFEGITLVSIPAGSFRMGAIIDVSDIYYTWETELPVHEVSISAFQMSAYEITQEQYEAVMGEHQSHFSGENLPVERITWFDAALFCNVMSIQAGLMPCYDVVTWECDFSADGFRLPTEAEWEYACRAGTETKYYNGNSINDLWKVAIYDLQETFPVGSLEPNAWGLYDMHGNVAEWCNDFYDATYYASSPSIDPTGPAEASGSFGSAKNRVMRGGSFTTPSVQCRSACRKYISDSMTMHSLGFRVIRRP